MKQQHADAMAVAENIRAMWSCWPRIGKQERRPKSTKSKAPPGPSTALRHVWRSWGDMHRCVKCTWTTADTSAHHPPCSHERAIQGVLAAASSEHQIVFLDYRYSGGLIMCIRCGCYSGGCIHKLAVGCKEGTRSQAAALNRAAKNQHPEPWEKGNYLM